MTRPKTHAQRVAAAVDLLDGLELTPRDCVALMTAPASVPSAWRPARAPDIAEHFADHRHMWPRTTLVTTTLGGLNGELYGQCSWAKGRYVVQVACDVPAPLALDTLVHELAHVTAWSIDRDHDHGVHWGIEYARAYGAINRDHT